MGARQPLPNATVVAALRALLPTAGETLLLRAALDTARSAQAWAAWRTAYPLQETLASEQVGMKGLLPLLDYALENQGATVAPADLSLLRMARYREQLRSERYQEILRHALTSLHTGGIKVILLKGAALAKTLYPQPTLRHCHDIDLLIQPSDLPRATELLLAHDFQLQAHNPAAAQAGNSLHFRHASGLPIALHTRLFREPFFDLPLDDAWQSAQPLTKGEPYAMLAPTWELVHILGTVICAPSRARVTWVCDAHYLITANPTLDWPRVGELAGQSHLALAAWVLLTYLHEQHYLPMPPSLLADLQRLGAQASRGEVEHLLQCARNQRAVGYGELWEAASSWQERAQVARWMLLPLPPPDQATSWQAARFYWQRATRYLTRRINSTKPSTN